MWCFSHLKHNQMLMLCGWLMFGAGCCLPVEFDKCFLYQSESGLYVLSPCYVNRFGNWTVTSILSGSIPEIDEESNSDSKVAGTH